MNEHNFDKLLNRIAHEQGGCGIDWEADKFYFDRVITDAGWDGGLCGPARIAAFLDIPEKDATAMTLMGSMTRIKLFSAMPLEQQKMTLMTLLLHYKRFGKVDWFNAFLAGAL